MMTGTSLPGGILTDAAADIEPVEPGHDDVEQDEIDAELQLGEPFDAVARGLDVVPQALDQHLRDPANAVVVVDDEDAPAAERRWRSAARRRRDSAARPCCPVQPTSALRIASMPDSSCATIGSTCSNEPLRAVLTSSAHARATESAPTMATLPCSEWAAR